MKTLTTALRKASSPKKEISGIVRRSSQGGLVVSLLDGSSVVAFNDSGQAISVGDSVVVARGASPRITSKGSRLASAPRIVYV